MIETGESAATVAVDEGEASAPRRLLGFALFAVVALILLFTFSTQLGGLSFSTRDLVDTDGYMRYLRIEALLDGGSWFDPIFARSNFPFGESSHWTRLVDVLVAGLSLLLTPFLGSDALYWAAVWNGPLTFLAIGATAYWALRPFLPSEVRNVVMPAVLALPVVFLYTVPGRVDHHGLILVAVLGVVGWLIRLLDGDTRRAATGLGASLGFGLWLSVEFLVAVALTAVTLGVAVVMEKGSWRARRAATAFAVAGLVSGFAVVVERGGGWQTVEVDRISIAHVALALSIAAAFAIFGRFSGAMAGYPKRLGVLSALAAAMVGLALVAFPALRAGPFGMVDPQVREIWLYRVAELKPVSNYGSAAWPIMVTTPMALGLLGGGLLLRRTHRHALLLTSWLAVYTVLTLTQVRWGLFAHILALPLLLGAVAPVYAWLGRTSGSVLLRPLFLLVVIFAVPVGAIAGGSSTTPAQDCRIRAGAEAVMPYPPTTVLASQDLGPEILYRSNHSVIATPYHRNEAGILFVRNVMSMTPDQARPLLATREVGLILICPGRDDLTRPVDPSGSLYEALVEGPRPPWVRAAPTPQDTDFVLFQVTG